VKTCSEGEDRSSGDGEPCRSCCQSVSRRVDRRLSSVSPSASIPAWVVEEARGQDMWMEAQESGKGGRWGRESEGGEGEGDSHKVWLGGKQATKGTAISICAPQLYSFHIIQDLFCIAFLTTRLTAT
jgi:hypothetical protein